MSMPLDLHREQYHRGHSFELEIWLFFVHRQSNGLFPLGTDFEKIASPAVPVWNRRIFPLAKDPLNHIHHPTSSFVQVSSSRLKNMGLTNIQVKIGSFSDGEAWFFGKNQRIYIKLDAVNLLWHSARLIIDDVQTTVGFSLNSINSANQGDLLTTALPHGCLLPYTG